MYNKSVILREIIDVCKEKRLIAKLIIFILSSFLLIFWSSTSSYAAKEDFVKGCLKGLKSQEATTGPSCKENFK